MTVEPTSVATIKTILSEIEGYECAGREQAQMDADCQRAGWLKRATGHVIQELASKVFVDLIADFLQWRCWYHLILLCNAELGQQARECRLIVRDKILIGKRLVFNAVLGKKV